MQSSLSKYKKIGLACGLTSSALILHQIKTNFFVDKTNQVEFSEGFKKLLNEVADDQSLNLNKYDIIMKDVLNFEYHESFFKKSTLIVPSYLNFNETKDINSVYINKLLKQEFSKEIKDKELWFTNDGKDLISSFLLTKEAKKFLISKSLYTLDTYTPFYTYLLTNFFFVFYFQIMSTINEVITYLQSKKKKTFINQMFLKFKNSIKFFNLILVLTLWGLCFMSLGIKFSRDSDALTLTRSLANATTIKSNSKLLDYFYFSGGEEAYMKKIKQNKSIFNLFYKNNSSFFTKFTDPFDEFGNENKLLFNDLTAPIAYKNITSWEKDM